MPRQLKHVIRAPLKLQRSRRKYKGNIGEQGTTYLASVNGSVESTITGHYWVHDPNGSDANGNTTYGGTYSLPILPGAVIEPRPNIKVETVLQDGHRYIARMSFTELVKMGYDPHQTNLLNPRRKYLLIEQLSNLQSYPYSGMNVRVMPGIYRKNDGTFGFYAGSVAIDLTSYIPVTADTQVVACLWLDISTNTVTVTASSEVSSDTDLKKNPDTAMPYINECAASAPTGAIGITSYLIFDDTTSITVTNKFHDLRGIVGTGGGLTSINSYENPLTVSATLASGKETITHGVQSESSGVVRTTLGIWWDL